MEVQKNMEAQQIKKPLILDKNLEDRFSDVSKLGPIPEGIRILARKSCGHCHGTGVTGTKLSEPFKDPDQVKQTKNKKCPQHTERAKQQYNQKMPVYCKCL